MPSPAEFFAGTTVQLFAYGTLREPDVRSSLVGDVEEVGETYVSGTLFSLVDGYPAMVPGGGLVLGSVLRIPYEALGALDEYEGIASGLFIRRRIQTQLGACWTYLAGPELRPLLEVAPIIQSGDWLHR